MRKWEEVAESNASLKPWVEMNGECPVTSSAYRYSSQLPRPNEHVEKQEEKTDGDTVHSSNLDHLLATRKDRRVSSNRQHGVSTMNLEC